MVCTALHCAGVCLGFHYCSDITRSRFLCVRGKYNHVHLLSDSCFASGFVQLPFIFNAEIDCTFHAGRA